MRTRTGCYYLPGTRYQGLFITSTLELIRPNDRLCVRLPETLIWPDSFKNTDEKEEDFNGYTVLTKSINEWKF